MGWAEFQSDYKRALQDVRLHGWVAQVLVQLQGLRGQLPPNPEDQGPYLEIVFSTLTTSETAAEKNFALALLKDSSVPLTDISGLLFEHLNGRMTGTDSQFLVGQYFPKGPPLPPDLSREITDRAYMTYQRAILHALRIQEFQSFYPADLVVFYMTHLLCRRDLNEQNRAILHLLLSRIDADLPPSLLAAVLAAVEALEALVEDVETRGERVLLEQILPTVDPAPAEARPSQSLKPGALPGKLEALPVSGPGTPGREPAPVVRVRFASAAPGGPPPATSSTAPDRATPLPAPESPDLRFPQAGSAPTETPPGPVTPGGLAEARVPVSEAEGGAPGPAPGPAVSGSSGPGGPGVLRILDPAKPEFVIRFRTRGSGTRALTLGAPERAEAPGSATQPPRGVRSRPVRSPGIPVGPFWLAVAFCLAVLVSEDTVAQGPGPGVTLAQNPAPQPPTVPLPGPPKAPALAPTPTRTPETEWAPRPGESVWSFYQYLRSQPGKDPGTWADFQAAVAKANTLPRIDLIYPRVPLKYSR